MSALLLQAGRDTLVDVLAAPPYLGAPPGIIAALHTWSQTLGLPPHLHCLVTGGGSLPRDSGARCGTSLCCRPGW
jgi:hypothetical protein